MYVKELMCVNTCYCCPLLQPLDVKVTVNVMITTIPTHVLPTVLYKGCQRCVDLEMEHSIFINPSSPTGNLVQRSVERVFLIGFPLHFVCEAVEFFGHVKELECKCIRDHQQVCLCIVWQPHEHSSVCRNCSLAENR